MSKRFNIKLWIFLREKDPKTQANVVEYDYIATGVLFIATFTSNSYFYKWKTQ